MLESNTKPSLAGGLSECLRCSLLLGAGGGVSTLPARHNPGILRIAARALYRHRGRGGDLLGRYVRIPTEPVVSTVDDGLDFILEPATEPIERAMYTYGGYELGTLDVMRQILKPTDTVLDVGANIGLMTCVAARRVSHVIAMEPAAKTAQRLRLHIKINGLSNVTVLQKGCRSHAGEARLYLRPEFGIGATTMLRPSDGEADEVVEVVRIDDVIEGPVDFIKLDIEGYELPALRGALGLLERCRPLVCMEYSRRQGPAAEAAGLLMEVLDAIALDRGTREGTTRPANPSA